jgi:hypothetical protein
MFRLLLPGGTPGVSDPGRLPSPGIRRVRDLTNMQVAKMKAEEMV